MDSSTPAAGQDRDNSELDDASTQQLLLKLTGWRTHIESGLRSQKSLLVLMEDNLLLEWNAFNGKTDADDEFVASLIKLLLRHMIDGTLSEPTWEWQTTEVRQAFGNVMEAAEIVSGHIISAYKRYIRRRWVSAAAPDNESAAYSALIKRKVKLHFTAVDNLFSATSLSVQTPEQLRMQIEQLQEDWEDSLSLRNLASEQEQQLLDRVLPGVLAQWLRGLDAASKASLKASQQRLEDAQEAFSLLLGELRSLHSYAARRAQDYVKEHFHYTVVPDVLRVKLRWQSPVGMLESTKSLTEWVALGTLDSSTDKEFFVTSAPNRRHRRPSVQLIGQVLRNVDARADYSDELTKSFNTKALKQAHYDLLDTQLQHSAQVARFSGRITEEDHARIAMFGSGGQQAASAGAFSVSSLVLMRSSPVTYSSLLLFYTQDEQGVVDRALLYAPGKPDGQEWIVLQSLRAVVAEIGGWLARVDGREYVLNQLPLQHRQDAADHFAAVALKPTLWSLDTDPRGLHSGYRACLDALVDAQQSIRLAEVEQADSPRWYSRHSEQERRILGNLNYQAQMLEVHFRQVMPRSDSFFDFAKRTVKNDIKPYLIEKGISEEVDPETIYIDFLPELGDSTPKSRSVVDLAIFGYDDNSGIDNPKRGVRSTVGQDLSKVRSAELAVYFRRAYLGDQYAKRVRTDFLTTADPVYATRRDSFKYLLLNTLNRDLRHALAKGELSNEQYTGLAGEVATLASMKPTEGALPGTFSARNGVFRFTLNTHVVQGVYVIRRRVNEQDEDWLYTPQAPADITFTRCADVSGERVGRLHDYLQARVKQVARSSATTPLSQRAKGEGALDALSDSHRITDWRDEFDAMIEHDVTDIEDITLGRTEVVWAQVFKGLLYASMPLCMAFPPLAIVLDGLYLLKAIKEVAQAHRENNTDAALRGWLEVTWSALFAVAGVAGIQGSRIAGAIGAGRGLKPVLRGADTMIEATSARLAGGRELRFKFKPSMAVDDVPKDLEKVTEPGVWYGTYRSNAQPAQHFILCFGKHYRVVEDGSDTLRLVNARNPHAGYKPPIRLSAKGRWVHDSTGLRGGVAEVDNLAQLRRQMPDGQSPHLSRAVLQGEALVANWVEGGQNFLYTINLQSCVGVALHNPVTRATALLHVDVTQPGLVRNALSRTLDRIRGDQPASAIESVLVGSDWPTLSRSSGTAVFQQLQGLGMTPVWRYYSTLCFECNYGMSINMTTGAVNIFRNTENVLRSWYAGARATSVPAGHWASGVLPMMRLSKAGSRNRPGTARGDIEIFQAEALPGSVDATH
ncbi:hypothetical protein ACIQUS_03430 [Pseudomonas sp. NPDC090755]|uniref:hypothetical protein n=1 Tax=Pseudomonas sp. NPDC090755 TaxID=3364481 RepID=UPI00383A0940